jgi:hypothetical protein
LGIGPELSGTLNRVYSLAQAKVVFEQFRKDAGWSVGEENNVMEIYCYDEEGWESAKHFEGIGCPFDYPSYRLIVGPRGGTVLERC